MPSLNESFKGRDPQWILPWSKEIFPGLRLPTQSFPGTFMNQTTTRPNVTGSASFFFADHYFIGHIPAGEILQFSVSFVRKIPGGVYDLTPDFGSEYGPQDRIEFQVVHRNLRDEGLNDVVLANGLVSSKVDDPLRFEDSGVYEFVNELRGSPVPGLSDEGLVFNDASGRTGASLDTGQPVYLKIVTTSDNSSDSDWILRNVERINVTVLFGSFAYGSLDGELEAAPMTQFEVEGGRNA